MFAFGGVLGAGAGEEGAGEEGAGDEGGEGAGLDGDPGKLKGGVLGVVCGGLGLMRIPGPGFG